MNGILQTGAAHLRRNQATALANGDYVTVSNFLNGNGTNLPAGTGPGTLTTLPSGLTGVQGRLLRNGCDRMATGQTTIGPANSSGLRCFPENYITLVPQAGTNTYLTNLSYSNYHSLQTQVALRPTHGFNYQATYTWSKNLGLPICASGGCIANYTDPSDRGADYTYTNAHREHEFRSNGTFELPIGRNKLLLGNSSGLLSRLVEHCSPASSST